MGARPIRRRQTVFVGDKIRQLRKERKLTQAELAQKIGVQQSDLCRMEIGEYKVSLDVLFRVLSVFGLQIGEFFRDESLGLPNADRRAEIDDLFTRLDPVAQDEVLEFLRFKARRAEPWTD